MHYYAVRPRKDSDVPFVRMLDENSRGKRLFDTVCAMQGEQEAELGRRIGEYCGAQRKNEQKAAGLTWRKVAEDAEREERGLRGRELVERNYAWDRIAGSVFEACRT